MNCRFLIPCFLVVCYVYANDNTFEGTTNGEVETETSFFQYDDYPSENPGRANGERNRMKMTPIMKISPPATNTFLQKSEKQAAGSSEPAWISRPLREGLTDFSVKASANPLCNLQSALYEQHLKNHTLWAVRMAESTQTEPVGIIGGSTYQMGNFEECIKTLAYGVKGKYCLTQFRYSPKLKYWEEYQRRVPADDFRDINHEESVWQTLVRLKKDPVRIDRQTLYWGICVPASCAAEDLEYSLNETLIPIFEKYNVDLDVTVDPVYCHIKDKAHFTTGFYVTITFMALLLLLNILSTFYDLYEAANDRYAYETEGWREFVGCFSLWRNTYSLGVYNKNTQVKFVNAGKTLMMLLIIYGHSLMYILGYPQFNAASIEEVYRRGADIALVNTNIVDIFFSISGFITFYYGYHPTKIGGIVYVILSIIFRYIRLMPVFALLMAYTMYVLPYTSDGPIWNARIGLEVENCEKNWWLNLLLLNNFIDVENQCLIIGWYVTTDVILCIVASVLVFVIVKKPTVGITLTVSIFLVSIVSTFLVAYVNTYNGLMKLYMPLLENPRKSIEFKDLYSAIYSRAGPYLCGFMNGYVVILAQKNNFKLSTKWLIIGGILSMIIGEGSQYYGVVFYQFGRSYNLLENALYASLHRILFALLGNFLLLCYMTTGFGLLDRIFNHRIFTILGRMTYSVFLVNTLSLLTLVASVRTPVFYSYKMIMFLVFGDIVTTYVLGYMFYLYAEGPVCALSKLMQKQLAKLFEKEIQKAKLNADKVEERVNTQAEKAGIPS